MVQHVQGRDLSPAKGFGEINVILSHNDIERGYAHVLEKLDRELSKFDSTTDYLLLIGNPIAIGLAIHVTLGYANMVKVLEWVRNKYEYRVVEVVDNG